MMKFKLFYCTFPDRIRENARAFILKQDGYAAIFIDCLQSKDQQERSLRHELAHLSLDHLTRPLPPDAGTECNYIESEAWEAEADRYAKEMTPEEYDALMQWVI